MDAYLYRLIGFNFEDEEDADKYIKDLHKYTQIMETKLTSILPMAYGYFDIGMNYIEIYPYEIASFPSKPISIFNGKEQMVPNDYSILIPYQNKQLAKETFSKWLEAHGYIRAARSVMENPVRNRNRVCFQITAEAKSYAKHWDKIKISERNAQYFEIIREAHGEENK